MNAIIVFCLALVNTLVHADYSGRVSVLVVKRPDLFGFRNLGNMRISVEQAILGGESDCRNRIIHQMFLMIGLGERAGSGVPKIFSEWKRCDWRPPALYEKDDPEQTLLELRMIDFFPVEVVTRLRAHLGSAYDNLPELDRLILATVATEQIATHHRIMEMEEIILSLCEGYYLTLQVLAQSVNRTPDALRQHYLKHLVEQGRLGLAFPTAPTHPQQAYTTMQKVTCG